MQFKTNPIRTTTTRNKRLVVVRNVITVGFCARNRMSENGFASAGVIDVLASRATMRRKSVFSPHVPREKKKKKKKGPETKNPQNAERRPADGRASRGCHKY